jgi:hypothetical protein
MGTKKGGDALFFHAVCANFNLPYPFEENTSGAALKDMSFPTSSFLNQLARD